MGFVAHRPLKIMLYAGYTFLEYAAFSYFIFLHIGNKKFKKIQLALSVLFFVFITVYSQAANFKRIDSIPIGVEAILIITFACYYLYEEMKDSTTLFIYLKPTFWIVFGIILYLAGSFFIYIYAGTLSKIEGQKYWYITNIFSIIKNVFFSVAILLHAKSQKQTTGYNLDLSRLN